MAASISSHNLTNEPSFCAPASRPASRGPTRNSPRVSVPVHSSDLSARPNEQADGQSRGRAPSHSWSMKSDAFPTVSHRVRSWAIRHPSMRSTSIKPRDRRRWHRAAASSDRCRETRRTDDIRVEIEPYDCALHRECSRCAHWIGGRRRRSIDAGQVANTLWTVRLAASSPADSAKC